MKRLSGCDRVTSWIGCSEIAFTTRKIGRRIILPLVRPLGDYLAPLPGSDNPDAFIFPRAASATRTGTLSNQFREILVDAGLVVTLPGRA